MPISIIIPTYNRAKQIMQALKSVAEQSAPDWECVVVDDFSSDNTQEVVKDLANNEPRIHYLINKHSKGAQGARNTGLEYAKYEWVIFFDSDNIMHKDFVEKMLPHLNSSTDVCACCSNIIDINNGKTGKIMNPGCMGNIHDGLFSGKSYVDFNHSVIRKSKLFEIGTLDENCPSMQEWDTHIRLSKICTYSMIEDCLIDYFVGGKDTISSDKKREVVGRLYILRKHHNEWNTRQMSMTLFAYQIYRFILMNQDSLFIKEKKEELKQLVPFLTLRVIYGHIRSVLATVINKIIKQLD